MNIHASLLPRWRGAAPIHRAIEAGDAQTGVTIMQMDEGLDTGDMLLAEKIAIADSDTTGTLHDKLASLGGRLIVEALEIAACGGLTRTPQPEQGVTYANKIDKAEATVDWTQPADVIARRVRAFNPAPGATATLRGETVKLWRASAIPGRGSVAPGTVVAVDERGIGVACGDGARLEITELQRAGGKRLPASDFVRGFEVEPGMRFEPAA
jgi:methionyl-tRNA formyltransferase